MWFYRGEPIVHEVTQSFESDLSRASLMRGDGVMHSHGNPVAIISGCHPRVS